jgi:hypothetical protein
MKFSELHFNSLRREVEEALSVHDMSIEQAEAHYGSEMATLWGLFWLSGWTKVCREYYLAGDYKDSHITSAMRTIVKQLKQI